MSANRVMRNISRFIEEKLGLKVNMTKSKVDKPNGLKYLGFGFYFDLRAQQYKAKPDVYKRQEYIRRDEEEKIEEVKRAIDGVDLDIKKGSFVAVLGHNGSGKSTFAKHINGLLLPTEMCIRDSC